MKIEGESKWQINSQNNLLWAHWFEEPEYILYSGLSGDTHLIDGLGHLLITVLQSQPQTPGELITKIIAADNAYNEIPDFRSTIQTYLKEYQKRGLLEVCLT